MLAIHKIGLMLAGICVVLISVGIVFGTQNIAKSDSNDTLSEYEAYDEDYLDNATTEKYPSGFIQLRTGVISANEQEKDCDGTIKLFVEDRFLTHLPTKER